MPAAHYLVVTPDASGGWREHGAGALLAAAGADCRRAPQRPVADLERELVAHLDEAVRLRLIADVPLGAFLSGGINSASVVATMARVGGGRVKTFSIGFGDKRYDETRYARMVAERYGTDHEEFIVEPDAVAILPRLVWHYGEPFADPSAIPTYYVSEMARRKVTVALNGDGGDEAFLGYSRYQAMRHLSQLDRLPQWGRLALARLLGLRPVGASARITAAADPRHPRSLGRPVGAALCRHDRVLCRPRQGGRLRRGDARRISTARRSICWRRISPRRTASSPGRTGPTSTPICPTI